MRVRFDMDPLEFDETVLIGSEGEVRADLPADSMAEPGTGS
jgi:hypothetical protein